MTDEPGYPIDPTTTAERSRGEHLDGADQGAAGPAEQWRASFDARVTFRNGGDLSVHGFRIDVPQRTMTTARVGELFIRHLGLLMTDEVVIENLTMLREAHKGGVPGVATAGTGTGTVELSHDIHAGMVTYPGLPGPTIEDHLSREQSSASYTPGTSFQIGRISMVANTGTYLDTPFHRFAHGADLSQISLDRLVDLVGVTVRLTGSHGRGIDRTALLPYDLAGRAVLLQTGWDTHWGSETYAAATHPFLTADGAAWLAEQGAALVGIDSINIDDIADGTRPAHTRLLAAGIPVVEHLTGLGALPVTGYRFHAAPPRVAGMGTFPVRAYAIIDGSTQRD